MKQDRILVWLAALALVGVGCTSVNTVANAEPQGQRQMIKDSRVITDRGLNRTARVVGINTTTTPSGIMRIQVEVLNLRRSAQTFFYNLEWFDLNGMQVTTAGGGWTEHQIMGKETATLQATAPSPACKDFRMKLIEHRR